MVFRSIKSALVCVMFIMILQIWAKVLNEPYQWWVVVIIAALIGVAWGAKED